jgi:transposase
MGGDRVEVITRVERRRRWSTADKLRLVAATREPGATVAAVARAHGVAESLLYAWRGRLAPATAVGAGSRAVSAGFAPVCVVDGRPSPVLVGDDGRVAAATIEIELPNGCRLRVHERVATHTLRKMIAVLGSIRPGC